MLFEPVIVNFLKPRFAPKCHQFFLKVPKYKNPHIFNLKYLYCLVFIYLVNKYFYNIAFYSLNSF